MQLGYIKPKYDLELTKLCLTKHPKSSNLWYHRYLLNKTNTSNYKKKKKKKKKF